MDKEMQRNMLLAIVLSILIMTAWTYFFAPKKQEQQEHAKQQAVETAGPEHESFEGQHTPTVEPEPFEEQTAPPEIVPPEELQEARDVVVETAHMVATFSTLGGRLTSLRLPEYTSKVDGDQVDLVSPGQEMQWPLALTFKDPAFGAQTENFVYACSLYEPSGEALNELADGLRLCSGRVPAGADERDVQRQFAECLPERAGLGDLRTLALAIAGNTAAGDEGAAAISELAEALSKSTVLLFSRQMTPPLRLIKAFVFPLDAHSFEMYTVFHNTSSEPMSMGHGRASYSITWMPGLESSERAAKYDELVGIHLVGKDFKQKAIRKLKAAREFTETLTWIGLKRKYFFLAMEPGSGLLAASMEPLGEKEERVRISLDMGPIELRAGEIAVNSVRLCAGPMLSDVLKSLGPGFDQIINFGFFDYFGKILLAALLWFNKYVQNYGLAIILLTVVVRVGLFPLNQKSYKSMRAMQALQPLVNELREKHKKNPQEMNKKMMALYKEHKVNPMGGCLPLAFQMPVFIALFQALRYAVELRGAHFLWIIDLSEPDRLFTLTSPISLPINLLPLLVIGAMLIQQKMTPVAGGQSEAQQKMMQFMPVIFGFLFYSMPSGLTVYFLVSTVLGLVQQYFVQKAA